jgi:hypothetical protein
MKRLLAGEEDAKMLFELSEKKTRLVVEMDMVRPFGRLRILPADRI